MNLYKLYIILYYINIIGYMGFEPITLLCKNNIITKLTNIHILYTYIYKYKYNYNNINN